MSTGADKTQVATGTAWLTVVLCLLASAVEGFDIQSAGVAATRMGPQFGLTAHSLGLVLAAGPLGLLFGAAIGGRLADRVGRKWVLVGSLVAFGLVSAATAICSSYSLLLLLRLLTGLGLGGALPNLIALTAEAVGERRRNALVGLTAAGMPLGGVVPGLLAAQWAAPEQWRVIFWVGGLAPLGLALLLAALLPESQRFRQAMGTRAPRTPIPQVLLGGGRATSTVLLAAAFFCAFLILYLLQNWLPSLMVARGFSRAQAGLIQAAFNVGGALGAVGLGMLMDRSRRAVVLVIAWCGVAGALLALGRMPAQLPTACAVALAAGVFVTGSQLILYGLASGAYATAYRATGVGFAVAIGRLGSIIGPLAAAALIGGGMSAGRVLGALVPIVVLGGAASVGLGFRRLTPV